MFRPTFEVRLTNNGFLFLFFLACTFCLVDCVVYCKYFGYGLNFSPYLVYQVKRLYDTFHEPFKRVVASRPAVPETSAPSNAEPGSVDEEDKEAEETEDESKRRKKEPELTVKSALSVAFSKYADKVNKKNSKTQREEKGETSAAMEAETEKR